MVNASVITPSLSVDFDPSITEDLLKLVLSYAKQFFTISDEDLEIIMHARKRTKSPLFNDKHSWKKEEIPRYFMLQWEATAGAEVCEFLGLYTLSRLNPAHLNRKTGQYRDDGLAASFKTTNTGSLHRIRKGFLKNVQR